MKAWKILWFLSVFALFLVPAARAESIKLPLTLDMQMLRSLIVRQAYPLAGEKASLVNQQQGCNQITLFAPQVSTDRGYLRFQSKVLINWGSAVMGSCVTPLHWEGSIVLWQRPRVNAQWQLSFETVNSIVLDKQNKQTTVVDLVWSLLKDHVHGYLNRIAIDLAPPVNDMKACLLPMFGPEHQQKGQRFLASMRPEPPMVHPDGVQVNILAEIETTGQKAEPAPLPSQQGYARIIELWHAWDAFLLFQLKQFTDAPLTDEDRRTLLDAMLTARYEFTDAVAEERLSNEFIRGQFLNGWNQLAPVFRNHLYNRKRNNLLGYLAYFTASDALRILDQLGPSIGIEISEDGFRRLAALISPEPFDQDSSPSEVDPKLRKVLGLDPLPESPLPADKPIPIPTQDDNEPTSCLPPPLWHGLAAFFSPAQALAAMEPGGQSADEIRRWTAELTPADALLPKVREVLQAAAARQFDRLSQPANKENWFTRMTMASAWQESCFRQFYINNKAITFLLSSNNSSVGIMQVNELVWRGVYNTKQLRWNIAYNSMAGCEILSLYLRDYLLKTKSPVDLNSLKGQRFLAAWLYALYNGGPGQRNSFLARYNGGKLLRAEKLFLDKFEALGDSEWINRVHCLP